MLQSLLHGMVSFVELVALSTFVGVVLCCLWTAHLRGDVGTSPRFVDVLRRLLMLCLTALVLSSIANLMQRTMEMSGLGITEALPLVPTVLFKTHYGIIGFVRSAGLGLALVVWLVGRRHIRSRGFAVFMLWAASAIAFSRSATSHAADFGDLSVQELSDWLHLLASSSWGGTLLAVALAVSPSNVADNKENQRALAETADRFYAFFGPAFALLMATGLYNAWVEVGGFEPLWTTPYGRILFLKLLLFALLTVRYIAPPQHGKEDAAFAVKFLRRTRIEALFVLPILFCVALFTHEIPARHVSHTMPDHSHTMEHGHSMEKAE